MDEIVIYLLDVCKNDVLSCANGSDIKLKSTSCDSTFSSIILRAIVLQIEHSFVYGSASINRPVFARLFLISDNSIFEADVLICDCSGISLEYAMGTERPVIFLDYPIKIKNPDYKEIDIEPIELSLRSKMGLILSPEELDQIPKAIVEIRKKADTYKNTLRRLREENLFAFGQSSQIGADYIIDALKS